MQPSTTTTMTGPATVAALVALALAAAAVTRASAQSPDFSTGALNEPWVLDEICRFGELPGARSVVLQRPRMWRSRHVGRPGQ